MHRDPARQEALQALADEACRRLDARGDAANDGAHVQRVWRNARVVGLYASRDEGLTIDGDVLKVAVFTHDLGRGLEQDGEHHTYASARIAEELLRAQGLDDMVWPVGKVVLEHSASLGRTPSCPESWILRDAERLDALGALGIARCMITGGLRSTPCLYDPADPLARKRDLDDERYLLDHFRTHLFGLAEQMHTAYGRKEGLRRARVLRAFYDALLKEAGFGPEG